MNRAERAAIAQETLAVIEAGKYQNQAGDWQDIAAALARARAASVHYSGGALAQLPASPAQWTTRFSVGNESTFGAARRLAAEGHGNPLCLNFASACNPGGGFLGGSEAQEENLAKSSGLYSCIAQFPAMYEANRALGHHLFNDDMIYSPGVPVFRDDAYGFLDTPLLVSVVSAPAVNRSAVERLDAGRLGEVEAVMQRRMEKMLALAAHHGHRVLVLGAWGCGVFGNPPAQMAAWFAACLRSPRFAQAFERVHFAVLDRKNDGSFAAFQAQFLNGRRPPQYPPCSTA